MVKIGVLPEGKYKVFDSVSKRQIGRLEVVKTDNPKLDDYPYVPVEDAYILHGGDGTHGTHETHHLLLTGTFTETCQSFDEVKVSYYRDVIVVLPIMKKLGHCQDRLQPFTKKILLEVPPTRRRMIHIRSHKGKSLNRFYYREN